jgi:hypothetical protein
MARSSRSTNGAAVPAASGNGATPADIDTARSMVAATLQQEHRLLQWLAQAQRLQADALKAWDGAVTTAANNAERAAAWDDLFTVQRDLVSDCMARLTNSETSLLSSWLDLQTEFAQQMQDRSNELARKMWNGATQARPAPSEPALTPAAWFDQSQAALQMMLRPWSAVLPGNQGG